MTAEERHRGERERAEEAGGRREQRGLLRSEGEIQWLRHSRDVRIP